MHSTAAPPRRRAPDPHRLLAWYDSNARDLPWRARGGAKADAYAVWLSEIMLQQTTVAAVAGYFRRFLRRWPDVASLAAAPIDEVMREWAGLGYYSRARNLHAAAKAVAAAGGRFPADEAGLRALPGIGAYTAAAIAAIAFGARATAVDANIERVVARLFAIDAPLPAGKAAIRAAAETLTPAARTGDYTQAMMDLGSAICTPKRPRCGQCPFAGACAGQASGDPERFPVKAAKKPRPLRRGAAFYLADGRGNVLLGRRPPKGLLGGMSEFPGTEWRVGFDPSDAKPPLPARLRRLPQEVAHGFTHFELRLTVFAGDVAPQPAPAGLRWVRESDLAAEGLPTVMAKVAEAVARDRDAPGLAL